MHAMLPAVLCLAAATFAQSPLDPAAAKASAVAAINPKTASCGRSRDSVYKDRT